jgi:hypothetical protein
MSTHPSPPPAASPLRRLSALSIADWLLVAGLVIQALGHLTSHVPSTGPDAGSLLAAFSNPSVVEMFGLLLFLGGIAYNHHRLGARIEKLDEMHADLVELRALAGARNAEVEWLAGAATMHEIGRQRLQRPAGVLVSATHEVLHNIIGSYAPSIARDLLESAKDPGRAIRIPDNAPIYDMLGGLARELPEGSVWLGISLLDNPAAWTNPQDRFNSYTRTMRDKASAGELMIGRLYYSRLSVPRTGEIPSAPAEDESPGDALLRAMLEEAKAGIAIRFVTGPRDFAPDDMSLVWVPAPGGPRLREIPDERVATALRGAGYSLLCAISYVVRAGSVLQEMKIHSERSTEAARLVAVFEEYWTRRDAVVVASPRSTSRPEADAR